MSTLKEQNEKLQSEISNIKNLERKHDMHLQDLRKELADSREKLRKMDKTKAELIAELEAEKNISHTKRQALEICTEEISKANQIIVKQSQELIKLKKTNELRTEVALQQEQSIRIKDANIKEKDELIMFLKESIDMLRREIPKELDSMRRFARDLETKYTERGLLLLFICLFVLKLPFLEINNLKLRLLPLDKENMRPTGLDTGKSSKRKNQLPKENL